MLEFLTLPHLTGFLLASIAIILAPGPDNLFLINQSLQNRRYQALLTAWGLSLGNLLHTLLAVTGVSAMILASPPAFNLVRLLGVAYLVLIAYKTITGSPDNNHKDNSFNSIGVAKNSNSPELYSEPTRNNFNSPFLRGFIMNILNIKVAIFFIAYLPQFVVIKSTHNTADISLQIFYLGLIFTLCVMIVFSAISLLAGSVKHIINFDSQQSLLMKSIFASIYILIALKLLI